MPRGLTQNQIAAAKQRIKRFATFIELDLPNEPVYAWDGAFPHVRGAKRYVGVGQFGFVEGLGGERAIRANSIRIGLHGLPTDKVPSSFLANVRTIRFQRRPLRVLMCFCDINTDLPLADPYIHWSGVADVLSTRVGSTVSVSLTGENFSSRLRLTNGLRMNHESHTARTQNSSDDIFKFLNRLLGQAKAL